MELVRQLGMHRHEQPGYFALAELPQRGSVAKISLGTGWWELDQIWRLYPGQFNMITGVAGHGKSSFLLNVICNMARIHGTRSFLYVPENEAHLREKLAGIWGSAAGFKLFCEHQCFIQSAVPDRYDQSARTLPWVLDKAVVAIERDDVDLLLIDPWNELERAKPKDQLMTDYIGECLMYLKQFCRVHNVVVLLVAHPTKAGIVDGKVPTLSDIEGCYSDDTEVLTRRGWLHHGQVTLSDDVACFDPETGAVVYHQPSRVLCKQFDGEMFRFKGHGYDLLVTPQHRMLIKPTWPEPVGMGSGRGRPVIFPKEKWAFCQAWNMPAAAFSLPISGEAIAGAEPSTVIIGNKSYPAEAFWRLVGWYVAEGHLGPTGLTWAQADNAFAEAFTATFAEANIPATVGWQEPHGKGKQRTGRWYVGNRFCPELVAWFAQHCGRGANKKRLPASAFDLSPRLKAVLLQAYLEGDGSFGLLGTDHAVTVSPGLRDDLQRLSVELGRATSFSVRTPREPHHQVSYALNFARDSRKDGTLRTQRNLTRESYSGQVWCLTVPTGAYFVRRNGRVAVCGNSLAWHNKCDNGLIVVRDPEKSTARVISAKVRENGAGKRGVCHFFVDETTGIFTPQPGAVTP